MTRESHAQQRGPSAARSKNKRQNLRSKDNGKNADPRQWLEKGVRGGEELICDHSL